MTAFKKLPPVMWRTLEYSIGELNLDITLECGQSFRWKKSELGYWTGVLRGRVWQMTQTPSQIKYRVYEKEHLTAALCNSVKKEASDGIVKEEEQDSLDIAINEEYRAILQDYFQLDVGLEPLYKTWSREDKHFAKVSKMFLGVRMLRQDPTENLFAFICSSNNHISRTSGMVEKLCVNFGEKLGVLDGVTYYAFPKIDSMTGATVENQLRELGFGYRARYIYQSAKYITEHHSEEWLHSLRERPYVEVKQELMKLTGVGAKVADCVCLMSMDKSEAIPVDTHVWQIAARDYMPKLRSAKSLTDKVYQEIGDHFRKIWGNYAGWAHSVLFSADLKKFKSQNQVEPLKQSMTYEQKAKPKKEPKKELEMGPTKPKRKKKASR